VSLFYERDGIQIHHGDCRDILSQIVPADIVLTSPPYNCGMEYGEHDDTMPMAIYWEFIETAYHRSAVALKAGGYSCWNVPNWIGSREERVFALDEYRSIFDRHLSFTDLIIWDKSPARVRRGGTIRVLPAFVPNTKTS
jgi:DNA modification methylase